MSETSGVQQASHDFATSIRAQIKSREIGRNLSTRSNKGSKPGTDRSSQVSTLASRVQRIYSSQSWATRGQIRSLALNQAFTKPLMRWTNGIGYINGQSEQSYRRRPHRQIHIASQTAGLLPGPLGDHRPIRGSNTWLPLPVKTSVGKPSLTSPKQTERGHVHNPSSKTIPSSGGVRRSSGLRTSSSPRDAGPAMTAPLVSQDGKGITRMVSRAVPSHDAGIPDSSSGQPMEASTQTGDPSQTERRSLSSAAQMVFRSVRAGLSRTGSGIPRTPESRTRDGEQAHPITTRTSSGGVRRSSGLRTSSSPRDAGPAMTAPLVSQVIQREMSDPEVRMELPSAKTNASTYEQRADRNVSRHAGDMQRSTEKPGSWASDGPQMGSNEESSLRLARQYQKLVSGNRSNLGHSAAGDTASLQRSYQFNPTGLESGHADSDVGPGNQGLSDLQNQNNITRSPAVVQRQTSGTFQTVPGMAKYDHVGEWLEKQLPALHKALKAIDLETGNLEERFKEEEVVYLSDRIYDHLRNRLDIENERTGWRVSQWVH